MNKFIGTITIATLAILLLSNAALCEDRLVVRDGATDTFKVDQSGKIFTNNYIGIGTKTPERAIHIKGSNALVRIDRSADSCGFMLTRIDNSGNVLKNYFFGVAASGPNEGNFFILDYGQATGGGTYNNVFNIDNDGNVGIGTDTPAGKLDVNGSIYQSGGLLHADYVFEKDYNLETIETHAKHMWVEKHLPSVPKATKNKHGDEIVEIGAHRRGLLEELEKAHIYIEQLNQRLNQLEKKLALEN